MNREIYCTYVTLGLLLLSFCVPRLKYTVLQRHLFFRLVFQHIAKQGRLLLHFQLTNLYCSQKQRTDLPKKALNP